MRPITVRNIFFFTLLALTTLLFFDMIRDFLLPVFWAVVLAVLFRPLQERWLRVMKERKSLASLLTLLTIVLIAILPLFLIGLAVARESIALYDRIASGEIDVTEPIELIRGALPQVTGYLDRLGVETERITQNLSQSAVAISQFIASKALDLGQNALRFTALFFIMLYILFFFLRDGNRMLDGLIRALPLGDDRERRLFAKFVEVSRATIKGTLVVGAVQGAIGGLLFWVLGIGAPIFWGVLMTLLSFLPAIGAAIIWLPAAIILIVTGQVIKGLILIAAGTLIIGLVDNLLRPILVGRDTQMPDFLILLATLGGITLFGISGFVIGPIIAAFFLVVWEMFADEYADQDENVDLVKDAALHPEAAPGTPDLTEQADRAVSGEHSVSVSDTPRPSR